MDFFSAVLAAAYIAGEGGVELRLFQTTAAKDFREIPTPGFAAHPYPAVKPLDVDAAKEKHPFLGLGASLTDAAADGSLVRTIQRHRLVVRYKGLYKTLPMPPGMWSVSTLVFR